MMRSGTGNPPGAADQCNNSGGVIASNTPSGCYMKCNASGGSIQCNKGAVRMNTADGPGMPAPGIPDMELYMKKYWYAAVTADEQRTIVDSARTLVELGQSLGLGLHCIDYYYRNNRVNRKLGVRVVRIPAITESEVLQFLKRGELPLDEASGAENTAPGKENIKEVADYANGSTAAE